MIYYFLLTPDVEGSYSLGMAAILPQIDLD